KRKKTTKHNAVSPTLHHPNDVSQPDSYAARREEKARHYTSVYGVEGWWFWDATRDAIWPPFPPAIAQKGEPS
ncbi:hypothetical protein, partial [Acetobacter indonesiensis]